MHDSSYEDIPYPSKPYAVSHPDHLFSLAQLFKVDAAHPDHSRVLEIGCASGGNIIPLADQMPGAEFLGIDLSPGQVNEGLKRVTALGLENIQLTTLDLRDLGATHGKFDYIICHGVFSWVSTETQPKILELCHDCLAPNGIAYVSYNVLPGWSTRGMIREMMLHHVQNIEDPKIRVQQARALLQFLVESTEGQTTAYAKFLREEHEAISQREDGYFFHDHLESENNPMHFTDFLELVHGADLQFVSEAKLASMVTENLPRKAAETLKQLTNNLHHQSQYTDFITNRKFRQSLLCHSGVDIDRNLTASVLGGFLFSGHFQFVEGDSDAAPESSVSVKCTSGRVIQTTNLELKTLFQVLSSAYPGSRDKTTIIDCVWEKLPGNIDSRKSAKQDIASFCERQLLQMMLSGDIEFRRVADRFTTTISERPRVSALSRLQASEKELITTQKHTVFDADPLALLLIPLLDGKKSKKDLASRVGGLIEDGTVKLNTNGDKLVDGDSVHRAAVFRVLTQLRFSALLVE